MLDEQVQLRVSQNYKGILLGFAVGDALGMPFEAQKAMSKKLTEWDQVSYLPSEYHKLKPGETTDDTGMALALARSLIAVGDYDPKVTAEHYLEWFKTNPVGAGKVTSTAMYNLDVLKLSWNLAGVKLEPGQSGNGPAMRIAPLAIFRAYGDKVGGSSLADDSFKNEVYTDSTITHKHPENVTGQMAFIYADHLYTLIDSKEYDTIDPFDFIFSKTPEITNVIELFKNYLNNRTGDDNELYAQDIQTLTKHNSFGIIDTVCSAIYCAEVAKCDFYKAMRLAIMSGGDTDTKAALTGALVAARYGLKSIPEMLVSGLSGREEIEKTEKALLQKAVGL
jgi:ADP-ribosyl-[dinitrogen reductase] hydrolase